MDESEPGGRDVQTALQTPRVVKLPFVREDIPMEQEAASPLLITIQFEFRSHKLTASEHQRLYDFTATLPVTKRRLLVTGYTDSIGFGL